MIARRTLLASGIAAATGLLAPRLAFAAAPTERRFVFIIQRGAADGLHIVPPLGDPGYAALRGPFLDGLANAHRIDATFSLHPALTRIAGMFDAKQALAVHAVASTYRDRSHFDGQNVLETGGKQAYAETIGWMNRLVAALPQGDNRALALAPGIPMALRGPAPVTSYAPSRLQQPGGDLLGRVSALYADDPQLAGLWQAALATKAMAGDESAAGNGRGGAEIGKVAAQLLAPADGARIMMIETEGWDTHSGQVGRLAAQLRNLDMLIGTLADGLGPAWNQTMVLVATEFGRTAAVNGTGGTDHGTASTALLAGGALKPGGIVGDWPTLAEPRLFENRDLAPSLDMRALFKGVLRDHLGVARAALDQQVFPESASVRPVEGLIV